ncbi:trans-sulfuration enzyme family protein [Kordiimonas pumila]|uniref:Trans-sulfuration enzyme family protein n=1 Tax=Kordiimonas pumila TaxID=2161677 RepID=A0ABV7D5Z8_9PROT|nr:aminotransferase class I/II-fold pyridoxal phosphate-dependent enzyme [Kordiimonas pumila]
MLEKSTIRGDARSVGPTEKPVDWVNDLRRSRQNGPSLSAVHMGQGLSTRSIHAGTVQDGPTGAVGTPIYQASTFLLGEEQYRSFEEGYARDRFIYTRYGNPSQWAVQDKIAALENAQSALVFSSGMAAISSSLMSLLDPGGHVVTSDEIYGGTYALFSNEFPNMGLSVTHVNPRDLAAIEAAIKPETQVLFFEVLTNPLLKVIDIAGLVNIARRHGLRVVVDATFATPILVNPLDLGVDIVVHSATKYLNGHSDLVAGVAVGNRKLIDQVWGRMLAYGGCLDPHCCFLLERGLKTLALRMRAHSEGGMIIAQYLEAHPQVSQVYYPFLPSHPDHDLAKRQMRLGGGMVTFEVKGGDAAALHLLERLNLAVQATSLGGVESLISLPYNTSHSGFTRRQREQMGISAGMVRLSVGVEDPEDLIADFEQAFA